MPEGFSHPPKSQGVEDVIRALGESRAIPLPGETVEVDDQNLPASVARIGGALNELLEALKERDTVVLPAATDVTGNFPGEDFLDRTDKFVEERWDDAKRENTGEDDNSNLLLRRDDQEFRSDGIETSNQSGVHNISLRDPDFEDDKVLPSATSPTISFTFFADLMSDAPKEMLWSGGKSSPSAIGETKDMFLQVSDKKLFWFWIPVREGKITRLSATMENDLTDNNDLKIYPVIREDQGGTCPHKTVMPSSISISEFVPSVPAAYVGRYDRDGQSGGDSLYVKSSNGYVIYKPGGSWFCTTGIGDSANAYASGTIINAGWVPAFGGASRLSSTNATWGVFFGAINNTDTSDLFQARLLDEELLGCRIEATAIEPNAWGYGTTAGKHPVVTVVIEYAPIEA